MAKLDEEKRLAYQMINQAWQITKEIFDNATDENVWEKANMKLAIETGKVKEPERELLKNLVFEMWDYINVKSYKKRKDIERGLENGSGKL